MQNLPISKRHFKINKVEYYFRLIPTKSRNTNEKMPSFITRLGMALSGVYLITKTKGKIECEKKMWGIMPFRKLKKWENFGTFKETWNESGEVSTQYLEMKLKGESPLKKIIVNSSCYDGGTGFTKNILIQRKNFRTKRSLLEEL
jgi:hypothetical protein